MRLITILTITLLTIQIVGAGNLNDDANTLLLFNFNESLESDDGDNYRWDLQTGSTDYGTDHDGTGTGALLADDANTYYQINKSFNLIDSGRDMTFELVWYCNATALHKNILYMAQGSYIVYQNMILSGATWRSLMRDADNQIDNEATVAVLDDGQWHYTVIRRDDTNNFYDTFIDATADDNGTLSSDGDMTDNGEWYLFGDYSGGNKGYGCAISEIRISDGVMTEEEITTTNTTLFTADEEGPTDSCSNCDGTSDCTIQCGDNCNITENIDMGGYDITFNGTGQIAGRQINITADITNWEKITIQNKCHVTLNMGGGLLN